MNMVLPKLLIFAFFFVELFVDSDAKKCPKGQRLYITQGRQVCQMCPDEFYQPEENYSQMCKPCTRCEENRGSVVRKQCTKETDTQCECRGQFVPWLGISSTCKCDIGFGLKDGVCAKCEDGYFTNQINIPCQKWRECKSGVNISGTSTSDVICNEVKSNLDITTPYITRSTSFRPQRKTPTQTTRTTTTTVSTRVNIITKKDADTIPSDGNHTDVALLLFGIIGLLILTVVTCKLHITPCVKRKPTIQTRDSLCRRPVEESGDGSLSSLKLNALEP
ncbi:tumor necrosis factor receptor superfamily member 4 [Mastacembelus armatus]|uniref:Tumor necrosis factor receptor superfamily member 4-like n=1 Tax=Mastacembelus armatus TaxID=205130 RepID=A0A7N8Y9J7_9TELE|nr:tumor necrosis factor receptor superfamily member 4-like [Mastacembelus armatus]